jgi:signal transduction histidine kinase/DNA-binding NarL/FixJ family response regulator
VDLKRQIEGIKSLPLGRLDVAFFGLSFSVLLISLVYGLYQIANASRLEKSRAESQALSSLQTFAAFVEPDLQGGHLRYVWKQLNRAVMHETLHCFLLVDASGQPLVDDPAVESRCPAKLRSDPDSSPQGWVIHRAAINPASGHEGQLVLGTKVNLITAQGQSHLIGAATQISVFLLCLILLSVSIRWVFGKAIDNVRFALTEISEGRVPKLETASMLTMPVLSSITNMGKEFIAIKEQLVEKSRLAAVAQAAQTLAHDVRRPFSLFKVLLETIQSIRNTDDLLKFSATAIPEVQRSMDSIEGLLQDVVQMGSSKNDLFLELVTPEQIIDDVLTEVFRGQPSADVGVDYRSQPDLLLQVDINRVKRVFSNIVVNACQAMSWRGRICIICEYQGDFARFTVGNEKSFIPEDIRGKLFDAFFTCNKRGGTGLGLAIAKKWVVAHGGQICCESSQANNSQDSRVEFIFTLPRYSEQYKQIFLRPEISRHSSNYLMQIGLSRNPLIPVGGQIAEELLESLLSVLAKRNPNPILQIVDDEIVYVDGIRHALAQMKGAAVEIENLGTGPITPGREDVILVDYDLRLPNRNGLDVIREYRDLGGKALVCLHTNRTDSTIYRQALEAGADTIFPKPLSPEHLARLLIDSSERTDSWTFDQQNQAQSARRPGAKNCRVAHVEDSLIVRLSWRRLLQEETNFISFTKPEEIFEQQEAIDVVITDLHFDNSSLTGRDVLAWVRQNHPHATVFASSNADASTVPDWPALRDLVSKAQHNK